MKKYYQVRSGWTGLLVYSLVLILLGAGCSLSFTLSPFLGFLGTHTPTPTRTATHTSTFTPSPTPTWTFTPTFTSTATETPTPTFTLTNTPPPTRTPQSSSGSGGSGGSGGSAGSGGCPQMNYGFESQVIGLVNGERSANGLAPLSPNGSLAGNAEAWSIHMATTNTFEHSGSIPAGGGENIAAGYASPGEVVTAWMNSDGHRANILNPSYSQAGAGYAFCSGTEYGSYWTMQFGP